MVDAPTTRKRLRKQSLGTNTNTWGDTKLNEVLDAIDQGMDGYLAIALTGDLTLTTTNYTTADQAKRRIHKFTGTLAAAASVTYPSVEGWYFQINASGATVTVKTAAGTGIAIPNGRAVLTYCDSVDFYSMVPNFLPTATVLANDQDLVSRLQMATAIATAGLPATAGTVLNSVADTTANYLSTKLTFSGSLVATTSNPGGNETRDVTFTFDEGQGALYAGVMAL